MKRKETSILDELVRNLKSKTCPLDNMDFNTVPFSSVFGFLPFQTLEMLS